ncbi:MAG: helix-turn-helix domain-containing protein, partial [Acidimicrobiales bacterium]
EMQTEIGGQTPLSPGRLATPDVLHAGQSCVPTYNPLYDDVVESAGVLLRTARRRAGLSQVELGRRAGVTQSVVSAYESGIRQPSLPMLVRLVNATGFDLDMRLSPNPAVDSVSGVLGERVFRRRVELRELLTRYGLTNARVFGSVARGEEGPDSDVDLLVDVPAGVGLVTLGRCQAELEELLGASVDLVPAGDLKPSVAADVLAEAVVI